MELQLKTGSRVASVTVSQKDGLTIVTIDGREIAAGGVSMDERSVTLQVGGRTRRVVLDSERGHVFAAHGGHAWELAPAGDATGEQEGGGAFEPVVTSPMPGKVLQVLVSAGDVVEPDGALLLLEAMKMEMTVRATHRCRVVAVKVEASAMVGPGETLVVLEEAAAEDAGA